MSNQAPRSIGSLCGLPVMVEDHVVGKVAGVFLDKLHTTTLGFEVESISGRRYFLPFALARLDASFVFAGSPLHLVDDVEHYKRRGAVIDGPAENLVLDVVSGSVRTRLGSPAPAPRGSRGASSEQSEAAARRASG